MARTKNGFPPAPRTPLAWEKSTRGEGRIKDGSRRRGAGRWTPPGHGTCTTGGSLRADSSSCKIKIFLLTSLGVHQALAGRTTLPSCMPLSGPLTCRIRRPWQRTGSPTSWGITERCGKGRLSASAENTDESVESLGWVERVIFQQEHHVHKILDAAVGVVAVSGRRVGVQLLGELLFS